MGELIVALVAFVGSHLIISGTAVRDKLVGLLGTPIFMVLYTIISLVTFVWVLQVYPEAHANSTVLWTAPRGLEDAAILIMPIAFLLAVIGLLTPNPTAAMMEGRLNKENAAQGIIRVTRHPVLSGIVLWGSWHTITSGHLSAVLVFGSMVFLSILGMISIDAKRAKAHGEGWEAFKSVTSCTPFLAILKKRNSFRFGEIGFLRIIAAIIVFLAFLMIHQMLFGRSPLPGGMVVH